MMRKLLASVGLAIVASASIQAQQAAESVNVMPVWVPCDLTSDPTCASDPRWSDAWRFGDVYLQRQVEGSLAPSSLNANRILSGFIDYSAVETFSDTGLGDTVAQSSWARIGEALAKLFHLPRRSKPGDADEDEDRGKPKAYAGSEAWIRLTWSVNGGATSTPFFMPGGPWDLSAAGQSAPFYQAANASSDPVVVAAPNGDFHVIFMAFTRGSSNWMVDGRFRDLNIPDETGRHGLSFLGYTTLASGNNATFGTFHDKPHATAVVNPASPVGYDLYVSYTLFNGNPGGGKFQSQLFVAKSSDGGVTFTTDKINQSTNENSGTWLAVSGGQVYAFWRGFGSTPTIFFVKQSGGAWTKAKSILSGPAFAPYDQGNIKVDQTNLGGSEASITPRSNGFPAAAVAADGTIFVVFQECADPSTGLPKSCGTGASPRIMLTFSKDGGATWSARKAFDNGVRTAEGDGLGYFWNVGRDNNNAHPQMMPSIACGAGQCLVTYWESRTTALSAFGWIGGYHRLMDLRGAALRTDGTIPGRSFQISRYPYRPGTKLIDGSVLDANGKPVPRAENVNDVARVNEIVNADGSRSCAGPSGVEPPLAGLEAGCIPRLNFYCRPQSGGGTTCFMGDYNAVVPASSFVRDAAGNWKVPTSPSEVPYVGFLTLSSDNRNLIPPASPLPSRGGTGPGDQLSRFSAWTPGVNGLPSCTVGGSRNTDLLFAKVSFGLLVTAPITAKTVPSPGDGNLLVFPLQVWNNSATPKAVTFTIDPPGSTASTGSFSKTGSVKSGTVTINSYSSTTREVYATTTSPVNVVVSDGVTTSGITFNGVGGGASAPSTPASLTVSNPLNPSAENPSAENPSAENISAENISAENISAENISAENISAENISAENLGVQETTWVIHATGDPTRVYTALANVDKAYATDYDFHLVIYRLASIGACVDTSGHISLQYAATVVANTGNANVAANPSAENPSAENPSAENISAENGFPSDPTNILNNSVFTPKPAPTPVVTASAASVPAGGYRIGEGVEAQPPEREFTVVKLLAIPKKPLAQITTPYDAGSNPASLTVSNYWCDANCTPIEKGSDLVVGPMLNVSPATLLRGQSLAIDAATVINNGTLKAGPRRYGYYLSNDTTLDLLPTGLVDTTKDVFLGSFDTFTQPLQPGESDEVPAAVVTIPPTTTPGTRYVFLYADDLRKVSELNEGNNITPAAQVVVLADTTAPVIAAHAAVTAEATGPTGAPVAYVSPTAIDNVDGVVTVACVPASGASFAIGATTVTCSASDSAGNLAQSTFVVNVVDTTAPALNNLPGNIVKDALTGSQVTWAAPLATDIVDGARPVTCNPPSGSTFPLGTTTVTCSASDTRGNTATATFTVTINQQHYGFVNVQNLPPPAGKSWNPGSAIPLKWQFTLGGVAVNSTGALPRITVVGPNGTQSFTPSDPGSSSFQPPTAANGWTWQFNWQTVNVSGSYSITITSGLTGDSFPGGTITLK